jgi:hypothetical protein
MPPSSLFGRCWISVCLCPSGAAHVCRLVPVCGVWQQLLHNALCACMWLLLHVVARCVSNCAVPLVPFGWLSFCSCCRSDVGSTTRRRARNRRKHTPSAEDDTDKILRQPAARWLRESIARLAGFSLLRSSAVDTRDTKRRSQKKTKCDEAMRDS